MRVKTTIAVVFMFAGVAFAKTAPQAIDKGNGQWCCPVTSGVRWYPFQSWTGKWSCIRGKREAESTWNIYKNLDFSDGGHGWFIEGTFASDPERNLIIEADFTGAICKQFVRKDGYAHSIILGVEYVQTCIDDKLGRMRPLDEIRGSK